MATWVWVVIGIAVVAVVALVVAGSRKRRTAVLRDRFGPEYDRAVEKSDDQRTAEAELRERERRRAEFDIKPLPEAARQNYADEWLEVQERFVDEPAPAAAAADALVTRVMEARGYPMQNFDAQADLVSVDHPETVQDYRFAHDVRLRSENQQASTEDLREALLRYRALFSELLRSEGDDGADPAGSELLDESAGADGPVAENLDYDNQQIGR
jgi:FtsZ-interacting cell division protein ZipA